MKYLFLHFNALKTLPADSLTGLTAATHLDVSDNKIHSLEPGIFSSCRRLVSVYMRRNKIHLIPVGVFQQLPWLRYIFLANNHLTSLVDEMFRNLTKLAHLELSTNRISSVANNPFHQLPMLTTLNLDNNYISTVPVKALQKLPRLSSLYLNNNSLTSLPDGSFDSHLQLTRLQLSDNQIERIEAGALNSLPKLQFLDLSSNRLSSFADSPFVDAGLESLRELNLSTNRLDDLSQQPFAGLDQLRSLDLSANNITNIANNSFRGLSLLQTLRLDFNRISDIEASSLAGLNTLTSLSLGHNVLPSSALVYIRDLSSLGVVNLENNRIHHLPDTAFDQCPSLYALTLRRNTLRVLNANVMSTLSQLSRLNIDVGYNQLDSAGLSELTALSLYSLVLDGNALTTIPISLLVGSVNTITELDLSNNSLTSDDLFLAIVNVSRLSTLRLDNNLLDTLPASLIHTQLVSSLTTLYLRYNNFTQISNLSVLSMFTKLQQLFLDGNAITAIPSRLFHLMNNLQTLSLSNNLITRLYNDSFQGIERVVTTLTLAGNRITHIDVGTFTSLYYIRKLDLSDNLISQLTLPVVMANVIHLSVARNLLSEFPAGLRSCRLLHSLDLSFNQITRLPRFDFFSIYRIQLISFANNRLVNIDDMRYLGTIDVLDFSWNQLSDVGSDILNRTATVQLLDLSHNRFVRVPVSVTRASDIVVDLSLDFNNISSLSNWTGPTVQRSDVERVSLRGNYIDEVSPGLMTAVQTSLTELDLRDNRLTTLNQQLFNDVPHLTQLMLDGNPLQCDCGLAWLRQLAPEVTTDMATCSSPSDVTGSLVFCYNISSCVNATDELRNISDVRCTQNSSTSVRMITGLWLWLLTVVIVFATRGEVTIIHVN